ncbi:MAG: type IX secretion system membrane protein PorP/SprF [Bacteroidota bacterium]
MKKNILFVVLISLSTTVYCQQEPIFANYLSNPLVLNPAYAGINNVFNASVSYRSQWGGFDGAAPNTASFSGHSSFFDNKVGGGLLFVTDKLGAQTNTYISAVGSYKIDFGNVVFSFGMQAGVVRFDEDASEFDVFDPDDPLFNQDNTFSKFNIGTGFALKGDNFFVGLSVPRLVNNVEEIEGIDSELYNRHFYLTLGYVYELNASVALRPSAILRAVGDAPASLDLSGSVIIQDKYTAGILTRNFNTYGLLAQMNISDKLRFGYIFEIPSDQSVGNSFNSHEITLMLDLEVFDFHNRGQRYF